MQASPDSASPVRWSKNKVARSNLHVLMSVSVCISLRLCA